MVVTDLRPEILMRQATVPSTELRPVILGLVRGSGKSVGAFLQSLTGLNLPVVLIVPEASALRSLPDLQLAQPITSADFAAHGLPGQYILAKPRVEAVLLEKALASARKAGLTHALVIPADGSYPADQIPHILEFCARHHKALVQGRRSRKSKNISLASQAAMSAAQRLLLLECGVHIEDGVCALRVYPLAGIEKVRCGARSLGRPMEFLVRASRSGVPITQITVNYLGDELITEASLADWLDASLVHCGLIITAIPRWPFQLAYWLSPFRAWRELRKAHTARSEFARGLAIGVFIACLPIYGVQSFLGLFAARKLNLNPLSVLTGTQLSWPPVTPVLIFLSIGIGHLLLHGSLPRIESWSDLKISLTTASTVKAWIGDWILGGFLLGLVLGVLTYVGSLAMFRLMPTPDGL
jgi:uncharacterized protein (DUF2062 family)